MIGVCEQYENSMRTVCGMYEDLGGLQGRTGNEVVLVFTGITRKLCVKLSLHVVNRICRLQKGVWESPRLYELV